MSNSISTPREIPRRGYRIADAALYMGVSPWFVEEKIRSGELPALKLCRLYTVLREDMDDFLDARRGVNRSGKSRQECGTAAKGQQQ